MNRKPTGYFTKGLIGIFIAAAATLSAVAPAAAEPERETARIDLLRPGRLLVQLTEQDRTEVAGDRYRLKTAYLPGRERGYRDVSRSNLLNSPVARYLARQLTGYNGR